MRGGRRQLMKAARFGAALPRYLANPLDPRDAERMMRERLARRADSLLHLLGRCVYGGPPGSPYRRLLDHAGLEQGDLERLIREEGVEGALSQLYASGVRVTLDEFRGVKPIRRGSLELATRPEDFDSPLRTRSYGLRTGGSGGVARMVSVDLAQLEYEATGQALFLLAFDLVGRPYALWRPAPPGRAGMGTLLRHRKLGLPVERWFSQYRSSIRSDGIAPGLAWWASRLANLLGAGLPPPRHVPFERADLVARWLSDRRGVLDTPVSSGVRVCRAAADAGLDLSGAFLRLGGEPLTAAKMRAIESTGARAVCHYSMSELGRVGLACADPSGPDDVHLLTDKLAVLTRPPDSGGASPLIFTTLMPTMAKLMLNVDVGDQAIVEQRRCGCLLGRIGLQTHLREIRSDEKLTSEGQKVFDADVLTLLEEVLPERFGGGPTDYQLVEGERNGLPEIEIVVSPEVPLCPAEEVIGTVLDFLGADDPVKRMMAEQWRQAGTLTVARRRPEATAAAKLMPLRVVR